MNTDPDIIAEAREFVLDSMDNASPDLTRIVLSQINKASREAAVKNFNTGGQAQGPQFDNNPNESATVTDLTSGIEYDTSTGLPVVEISQYESDDDRQEREARQAANFNLSALNNTAFAQLAGKAILGKSFNPIEEITGLNVPNIPTSPFGLALLGFSKIDENQTRNVLSQKSQDDQIDILSKAVSLENRQDAEFARSTPQPVSSPKTTSTRDDKLPGRREPPEFYESLDRARTGVLGPQEVFTDRFNPNWKSVSTDQATGMKSSTPEVVDTGWDAAMAAGKSALDTDVGSEAGIDVGTPDVDVSAPDVSAPDVPDHHGGLNKGGPVNMQVGGEVDNADTNMEVANMPMGVVGDMDGAPAPFNGGTGVEDDLDMEVEAGSYILNAEAVQLIGVSDINKVIRDAYSIAAALGNQMPEDYDPQNKVPIRISNGEAVIPRALVDIVGLDKLEKWNQKGLELRKQKEEAEAEQQQAQAQQPQVASEAPMQQQMGQLMDKGGEVQEFKNGSMPRPIPNPNRIPPTDHLETDKESYNTEYAFGKYSPKVEDKELGTRNISDLTLKELLEHQRKTVNNQIKAGITDENKRSSAMGAYQIISPTLKGLINTLGLDTNTKFTPELQDNLALYLLEERGVDEYFDDPEKFNLTTFQNNVAKEWASLPTSDKKSAYNQSLALKSKPFRKQLYNIQQEVEQGTITRLEGKYKILSIVRDAETELRYEEKIKPPLPKARPK